MSNNGMSSFATTIFNDKYAHTKADGMKETWEEVAQRVVKHVLKSVNASKEQIAETIKIVSEKKFIPGGRYLAATGKDFHQTQNCLLLKVEDSREGWSDLLQKASMALMTGAGIGVDYSSVRCEGKPIRKTGGVATGPLALAIALNEVGRAVMQGGNRRCLPSGSFIHTSKGLKKIENIQIGDKVLTFSGYHSVINKFAQGVQPLVQVITQTGKFRCTANHKIAVLRTISGEYEWVEASNLGKGDRLIFTAEAIDGASINLPEDDYVRPKMATTVKEISIPLLDTDLAWFIGYYHANGHSTLRELSPGKRNGINTIAVPKLAPHVADKIKCQLERFGVKATITDGDGECFSVRTASVPLALYIQKNIKKSSTSIRIPQFILENTQEIRSSYVAGVMDGDGSISHRPKSICSSVYIEFIEDLQAVCASLGIPTRQGYVRPAKGNWKELHHLNLVGEKQERLFVDKVVPFMEYKKFEFIPKFSEQFSYSFPPKMVKELPKNLKDKLHKNYKVDFPSKKINELLDEKLRFTPVSVKEVTMLDDERETWDIEIESRNEFYCNGLLVHNSAIWAGLSWAHPDIHKFINMKNWSPEVKALKTKDFSFPATMDGTNISVQLDDEFFKAYHNESHKLHAHAQSVYWSTVKQMLMTAEPGFSVDAKCNKGETLRNACCEISSADDSDICNLGSINMSKITSLEDMKHVTELATAFLLAGTVYSDVPYAKVDSVRTKNRRLGLGLMGLHEWMLLKGLKYGPSDELAKYLDIYSTSTEIAATYADNWELSHPIKTRAIAPTGTIGIISETSTGVEPLFCVAYKRRYLKGNLWNHQYVVDPTAKRLIDSGVSPDIIEDAYTLSENVERRVAFQAWLQKYVDHAISSTINLPAWGSELNNESLVQSFGKMLMAYLPDLRGITCYPDNSRGGQPLTPISYKTAIKHVGEVFVEGTDVCDIFKSGSCGT